MFGLTFFIIPMVQSYVDSGYFTVKERLKKALRRNVIYYCILGAIGIVLLFVIAFQNGWREISDIQGFAMAAANIFGLSIVVVLLAYGLLELPRHLWHESNQQRSLKYLQFMAPKVRESVHDAENELYDLETELFNISTGISAGNELRPHVDTVLRSVCPCVHVHQHHLPS